MEATITIAVLVACVWGAVVFLRGGLLAGAMAVLLAAVCFGHPFYHVSAGPIPLTSDRALWCLLIAQYFVWRRLGWTEPKRIGAAQVFLLALVGTVVVSTLVHDWRVHNAQPLSHLLILYLMPLGMYWVGWQARISERAARAMFGLWGVFGLYVALTAIAETQGMHGLVFPRYIVSPAFPEFLGRGRGPLLNPIANGILLGLCLAAALMAWPRVPRWGKLVLVAYSGILCVALYATLTRSVWMGGGLGLLLVLFLALPRPIRPWLLVAAFLGATAVVGTQWDRLFEFKRDIHVGAADTAESARLRPILAMVAWKMFLDRPLFGCGFGQYNDQKVYYLADRNVDLPLEKARPYVQHNVWLALLTETGLVGMTLFTLFMIACLYGAARTWRTAEAPLWVRQQSLVFLVLAANYLVNGIFHDVAIIPTVNMILFFVAGVTANAGALAATSGREPGSPWPRSFIDS